MTFLEMATSAFPTAKPAHQACVATIMEEAYIAALRSCAWRMGGVDYLFDGPGTKTLQEVINQVHEKAGPL